jgi:gliding motility associated protien GldN
MKNKKIVLVISFAVLSNSLFAQQNEDTTYALMPGKDTTTQPILRDSSIRDGYYNYDAFKNAKPIPLPQVNMGNVKFYKRIYRDIDLSDSTNSILAIPGESLMELIADGLKEGKITAFDANSTKDNPTGDAFVLPLSPDQAMATLVDSVLVPSFDSNGNQTGAQMKLNDFNPAMVTKFRIKEDIFYDNQRSRIETRIIGLAPLKKIEATGELLSEQPAFWLYFPQCRKILVTKVVTDPKRNIYNLSFDDVFLQHSFKSTIVKEANPEDEKVDDPAKIEMQIAKYKKDTWKY